MSEVHLKPVTAIPTNHPWSSAIAGTFYTFLPATDSTTLQDAYAKKLVTSEFSKTMEWNQSPRPCYDMVEEYNRSLDEYKDKVSFILHWSNPIGELDYIGRRVSTGASTSTSHRVVMT